MADEERDDILEEEDAEPSARTEPRRRSRRSRRQRRTAHSGDIFLIVLVFLIVIIAIIFDPQKLFELLYNKFAGLLLIVMAIEFLILKSMDRTRVYQMENARLREQKRVDRLLLKRSIELLREADAKDALKDDEARLRWKTKADVLAEEIRERF
ncbi:MAG: hypothetical protein PWP23_2714 [Candidatus Sumerlaeota bacterium]|nr:hypothetical protein [Candidatus Sumerlaeota bacterium]